MCAVANVRHEHVPSGVRPPGQQRRRRPRVGGDGEEARQRQAGEARPGPQELPHQLHFGLDSPRIC